MSNTGRHSQLLIANPHHAFHSIENSSHTHHRLVGCHVREKDGQFLSADARHPIGSAYAALELGGKSAFLLAEGADMDAAMSAAVRGCFVNNGQTCSATTRLIVPRSLLAEVEERVAALVNAMRVGNPLDDTTDIGAYTDARMANDTVRALRKRVEVQPRDDLDYVSNTGLVLKDGRRVSAISNVRPSSKNSAQEPGPVRRKFGMLVTPVIGAEAARKLEEAVLSLEKLESVKTLIDLSMQGRAAKAA